MGFGSEVKRSRSAMPVSYRIGTARRLVQYGLIPEFIGRLPVAVTFNELNKTLWYILTEPKNALVKQYKRPLEMDGSN